MACVVSAAKAAEGFPIAVLSTAMGDLYNSGNSAARMSEANGR